MAWEYADLFDSVLDSSRDDLLGQYWRSFPTNIRIGKMGYRTRTIKAGERLEVDVHPIFGREKERRLREARHNQTPEKQQQQNMKRAKHRLILLLETNFNIDEDYHLTLTYAEPCHTLERCQKDIRNFFARVRRARESRGLPDLKYLYSIGHDAGQRLHVHVILNGGIPREEMEQLWGKGYANGMVLQGYGTGLQGMANYLYRQNERERLAGNRYGQKSWSGSRNLKKPKERVSDTKMSNSRVKTLAFDFRNEAKGIMEKLYPGYTYQECAVYYSDVVDGVYIRCVLRRRRE